MLPGQPPYRMAKALRDKSMVIKRGLGEHARPDAPQGPPQSPAMERHIPRHGMSGRGRQDRTVYVSPPETPPAERRPMRLFKGTNGGPTSRYHVRLIRTRDRLPAARPMAMERS